MERNFDALKTLVCKFYISLHTLKEIVIRVMMDQLFVVVTLILYYLCRIRNVLIYKNTHFNHLAI